MVTLNREWLVEYVRQNPSDISEHLLFIHDTCIALQAKRVLELGVRKGHSSRALLIASQATRGHLTSVDLGTLLEFPDQIFEQFAGHRWSLILGNSRHVDVPEQNFDLLLIDSGHSLDLTTVELNRFAPRVRVGGVILLHDTIPEAPQIQVREAIEAYVRSSGAVWSVSYREFCGGLGILTRVE